MSYHHGDLRSAILDAAAAAVAADGVAALSLRTLASQVGVSHTAPRHHFGDKRGVITALAAQGYRRLAAALRGAGDDFLEVGVAYVRWALEHPAHYQVMFQPQLVDPADPELTTSLAELREALMDALPGPAPGRATQPPAGPGANGDAALPSGIPPQGLAAWSIVHGFVTLTAAGNIPVPGTPTASGADRIAALTQLARSTLIHLGRTG